MPREGVAVTKLREKIAQGPRRRVEALATLDRQLELEAEVGPVWTALDETREAS